MTEQRKYIDFDASAGYPAGPQIRYECGICGVILPSMPCTRLHVSAAISSWM